MKTLKFVNFGISLFGNSFRINPNFYLLKSYFKFKSANFDKINWLPPSLSQNASVDLVLNEIDKESIDILCLSIFSWNYERSLMLAAKAKEQFPDIKIIAGGPQLSAHKDPNFFDTHPNFDFIVYGDGEEAFCEIIDSIIESRALNENTVNTITKEKKYPFKIFNDPDYKSISPVLECKEEIERDVQVLRDEGIEHVVFNWEKTRGCPYKCSFCDWSSGLHHKVIRIDSDWKKELDFLYSLNCLVVPTDANWGLYPEDLEITEYAVARGRFRVMNFAKLHKERVFKIARMMFSTEYSPKHIRKGYFKLSFQDTTEEVLLNIDRPDVAWEKQKQYILDFYKEFPKTHIVGEFMVGIPGQTKQQLIEQFFKLEEAMIQTAVFWFWELLPNSPAYEKEYQEKFKIKTKKFFMINDGTEFENVESFYKAVEKGNPGWSNTTFVYENYSIDFESIIFIKLLSQIYSSLKCKNRHIKLRLYMDQIVEALEQETKLVVNSIEDTNILGVEDIATKKLISIEDVYNNKRLDDFLNKYQIQINN